MIDKKYPGRGYGNIELTQVVNYVKSLEVFDNIKTSFVSEVRSAQEF